MKTFKYLWSAFIAVFVLAACTDDIDYTPGEGEDPNSYGVYFPSQDNSGDVELDPADDTVLEFKAMRRKTDDAIIVPVEVTSSEEGLFQVSEIKFEKGQPETTFTVRFDGAEIAKTYSCSLLITDKRFAYNYGEYANGISFSVIRVQWNLVKGTNGETKGKWRDEFFTTMMSEGNGIDNAEKEVEIWERADKKGYYRIKNIYDKEYLFKILGKSYSNVVPREGTTWTIIDATNKDKVWFPVQPAGWEFHADNVGDNGQFVILSFCQENFPDVASATMYGKIENGILTFPTGAVWFSLPSIWKDLSYYTKNTEMTRLMFPGAKDYDYSVAFTSAPPADGKVNITAKLGADVAKAKYAYFEGELSASVIASKSIDIDAGTVASEEITASGTITAEMKETGIYTLVGNSYNAAGVLQKYGAVTFGYVKKGDERPVVMSVRTELTWEYEAEGHTPENSIKGIIFGEDIKSGFYALMKTDQVEKVSDEDLIASLQGGGKPFTAEQLEKINSTGYAPFFPNLSKGTSYTLLVVGDNGFNTELFRVEQSTQGAPDPMQKIYTFDDATGYVTKDELFNTTWNYYAIDVGEEETSRSYLGQVTFSENPNDGVDEESKETLDYINVTGLSTLKTIRGYTGDDTILAEFAGGGLVYPKAKCDMGMFSTYYVTDFFTWEENPNGLHTIDYALCGVYVGEGFLAFVPNDNYTSMGYTFTGMYFSAWSDAEYKNQVGYLNIFKHLLLVDPAHDPNAKTAAAVSKELRTLKAPTNYVELRGVDMLKAVWNEKIGFMRSASLEGEVTTRVVTPVSSTFSTQIVRPVGNNEPILKMRVHNYFE